MNLSSPLPPLPPVQLNRMSFRKLRIAWSVGWGILAVSLIVLWVRSYYGADVIQWSVTKWDGLQFTSQWGELDVRRCSLDGAGHDGGMDFSDWDWSSSRPGMFGPSLNMLGFNFQHLSYYIAFPCWAAVFVCIGLAAAPLLIPRQRFQFGVRTLLVVTTLVAVVLGLAVWVAKE